MENWVSKSFFNSFKSWSFCINKHFASSAKIKLARPIFYLSRSLKCGVFKAARFFALCGGAVGIVGCRRLAQFSAQNIQPLSPYPEFYSICQKSLPQNTRWKIYLSWESNTCLKISEKKLEVN